MLRFSPTAAVRRWLAVGDGLTLVGDVEILADRGGSALGPPSWLSREAKAVEILADRGGSALGDSRDDS